MKLTLQLITLLFTLTTALAQQNISGNYIHKTECLGIELDGSQTVKAWGNGKNKSDAVEQAKKNAVHDVLFSGIHEGKQDCETKPLIAEVNAREKYEDYFNNFFTDGGAYKRFISLRDENNEKRDKKRAHKSVTYGLVLRVLRSDLKKKLIADGILK